MNEVERFLLEHWEDARLLEESMQGVRTKYKELFEQIIIAVSEAHPELDASALYLTQSWTDGYLGFGRKSWPSDKNGDPSGLWVQCVRLEMLAKEDSDPPCAYLWIPKRTNLDFEAARVVINEAAKELLNPEELKGASKPDYDDVLLYFPAPSKAQLLGALCEGNGQGFVSLLVEPFEVMARFVPVLDKVFLELRKP